MTITRWSS